MRGVSRIFERGIPLDTPINNIDYLPSSHSVLTVQRKNWDPLVLGPALAMDRMPGPVCFRVKFSSSNLFP